MEQKKIPTLLGLVLLVLAIAIFGYAFDRVSPLLSRANVSSTPAHVMISNITDMGFTVSWTTLTPATGAIMVESDATKYGLVYDDRDVAGVTSIRQKTLSIYSTHAATFRNATPNTEYRVTIVSNGTKSQDTNGNPYIVRTGIKLDSNGSGIEPAFGIITTSTGKPAEGALVYLTLENGQTLSTVVKSAGSWVIPLHLVREKTLAAYISPAERINETMSIRSNTEESQILADTLNDNPMPEIVLGKDYDFQKLQANITPAQKLAQSPSQVLGVTSTTPIGVVAITKPKDNQAIPTDLPVFQGTGIPNKNISLIIGITNPQVGQAIVGTDGVWRYTPISPLSIGRQSVTITTVDAQNKPVAMTHIFEVLKSGTQVLGDATPSATIIPTPIDTPIDGSTLSGEPIPETGFPLPLILLLIVGTILITGGGLLYL